MKLRVTYHRAQDLVSDYDQQFSHGGLLVRVSGVLADRGATLELQLSTPFGSVCIPAHVIQLLGDAGVAVGFDIANPALSSLVQTARDAAPGTGPAPEHAVVSDTVPGTSRESESVAVTGDDVGSDRESPKRTFTRRPVQQRAGDARTKLRNASPAEKIQIALHGNKDERSIIMRDTNRRLHQYVIRNPQIQLDEVAAIARMTTVSVDILEFIASRREWARRPEIAISLVRNPKTPAPTAIRLLQHVSPSNLRQLAKMNGLRAPIQRAARKRLNTR